ncbi:MAG TPA: HEPN domain-containing protein [Candidatus Kapabacteria bacterium]|jgi:HEPN domain-containing protein|nr:HEPN domain-containing protein [Candidatus Kapabacteria bacterium]
MRPLTEEWLSLANGDYRTMRREFRVTEEPNYRGVCYHAQQCVEKLFKAFLHANRIAFPKTHDIVELIELALPLRPEWEKLIPAAGELTKYATDTRYPGDPFYSDETEQAVETCEQIRPLVLNALNELDQLRLE